MDKTDYFGIHDRGYQKIKADGASGWSNAEEVGDMRAFIHKALERTGHPKSGKLLEMGCGDGSLTLLLGEDGFDIHGVDISPTAIAWAQEKLAARGRQGEFRVGSVLELPYDEGTFDVVVDGHCSHCIIGNDRKAFWSEAFRVTRSGGAFIAMSMCGEMANWKDPDLVFDPATRNVTKGGIAGRHLGLPEDILGEIRAAGFRTEHWEVTEGGEIQQDINVLAVKP